MQKTTLNMSEPLDIPILFIAFCRIDTTMQVFEAIRSVKPTKLYIASDGPREGYENEADKINIVRKYLLEHIDWNCEVKKLFRENNVGCNYNCTFAITWFFENEEMGIILEDDTLPSLSFFYFCKELLIKYRFDNRIMAICGSGIYDVPNGLLKGNSTYYFSRYAKLWGWATWKRSWEYFDLFLPNFLEFVNQNQISNIWTDKDLQKLFLNMFYNLYSCQIHGDFNSVAWDCPYSYMLWSHNGLVIVPSLNLVSNLGIGHVDAAHGMHEDKRVIERFNIEEITHPEFMIPNQEADSYAAKADHKLNSLISNEAVIMILSIKKNILDLIHHIYTSNNFKYNDKSELKSYGELCNGQLVNDIFYNLLKTIKEQFFNYKYINFILDTIAINYYVSMEIYNVLIRTKKNTALEQYNTIIPKIIDIQNIFVDGGKFRSFNDNPWIIFELPEETLYISLTITIEYEDKESDGIDVYFKTYHNEQFNEANKFKAINASGVMNDFFLNFKSPMRYIRINCVSRNIIFRITNLKFEIGQKKE